MKPHRDITKRKRVLQKAALRALLAAALALAALQRTEAASNIVLWDTLSPLPGERDAEARTGWKVVPVICSHWRRTRPRPVRTRAPMGGSICSKGMRWWRTPSWPRSSGQPRGRWRLLKEDAASPAAGAGPKVELGRKVVEVAPLQPKAQGATLSRLEIVRNGGDETALEVTFSAKGCLDATGVFVLGKTAIVEIRPAANMKGLSIGSAIAHVIAPSFIGDDLILSPAAFPSAETLRVPFGESVAWAGGG